MNLREWQSNDTSFIDSIPEHHQGDREIASVLGLKWYLVTDALSCTVGKMPGTAVRSKRQVLKAVASVFDPLGFFAPITIMVKLLIQSLWVDKIPWDAHLPPERIAQWETNKAEIVQIPFHRNS